MVWEDSYVKIRQFYRVNKQQIKMLSRLKESLASWTRVLSPRHPEREKWLKNELNELIFTFIFDS